MYEGLDLLILASKMEERTVSQGMQASSRNWKIQRNGVPPSLENKTQPCPSLDFSPASPISVSDLQNYVIINLCWFKPLNM